MALCTPEQLERARRLRRGDTACEQRLWARLRGRRLDGWKFVRQMPVGPYVADFACREARLIVEVDGGTHWGDEEVQHDARRAAFLQREGWRVVRIWNEDVVMRIADVMETVLRACDSR